MGTSMPPLSFQRGAEQEAKMRDDNRIDNEGMSSTMIALIVGAIFVVALLMWSPWNAGSNRVTDNRPSATGTTTGSAPSTPASPSKR